VSFETETVRVEVDEECSKVIVMTIINTISYKLKELGEVVSKNLETYDLLLSHFPTIKLNREKFEEDTTELSKRIIDKIVDTYSEYENSASNKMYARTVFWRALMTTFIAIMIQEAENLGKDVMEFAQEQLGGVKVD